MFNNNGLKTFRKFARIKLSRLLVMIQHIVTCLQCYHKVEAIHYFLAFSYVLSPSYKFRASIDCENFGSKKCRKQKINESQLMGKGKSQMHFSKRLFFMGRALFNAVFNTNIAQRSIKWRNQFHEAFEQPQTPLSYLWVRRVLNIEETAHRTTEINPMLKERSHDLCISRRTGVGGVRLNNWKLMRNLVSFAWRKMAISDFRKSSLTFLLSTA